MTVHDDRSLDAELDRLRIAPAPRAELRQHVMAAVAREPRGVRDATQARHPRRALNASDVSARDARGSAMAGAGWGDAVSALWRELGGTRLAAPAFALALAFGLGMSWLAEDTLASDDVPGDDLVALAQFDDAYEGLEP